MIKLKRPELSDQKMIENFLSSYSKSNEWIAGSSSLHKYSGKIEEWILLMQDYAAGRNIPSERVPLIQYLIINTEEDMVGVANLRLNLNDYLLNYGGHIGYAVHPHYRRQGIATTIMKQVLKTAQEKNISPVLMTCADDNLISAKIIEAAGGSLEDKRLQNGVWVRRYWIQN